MINIAKQQLFSQGQEIRFGFGPIALCESNWVCPMVSDSSGVGGGGGGAAKLTCRHWVKVIISKTFSQGRVEPVLVKTE